MEIKRGQVYWINLNPTKGSEIKKQRPCVVIGENAVNRARRTIIVIPLFSSGTERPYLAIGVQCMQQKAIAVIDQIRAVDKSRFLEYTGSMDDEAMAKIEEGLRVVLGL